MICWPAGKLSSLYCLGYCRLAVSPDTLERAIEVICGREIPGNANRRDCPPGANLALPANLD